MASVEHFSYQGKGQKAPNRHILLKEYEICTNILCTMKIKQMQIKIHKHKGINLGFC